MLDTNYNFALSNMVLFVLATSLVELFKPKAFPQILIILEDGCN